MQPTRPLEVGETSGRLGYSFAKSVGVDHLNEIPDKLLIKVLSTYHHDDFIILDQHLCIKSF